MGMSDGVVAGALAEGAVVGMARSAAAGCARMWMEEWGIGGGGEWL